MKNLLYSLVLLPWVTEYLESGRIPQAPGEFITEGVLSALIGLGVYYYIKQQGLIQGGLSEIGRLAETDSLTELGNVRSLEEVLVREVARMRRMDHPFSCILMDVDEFRMINEMHGHEKGSRVLQVVASTIRGVIRMEIDRAFRYGSDEFLILLPETDSPQALSVAERLRDAFIALQPPTIPKKALSVSFGFVQLKEGYRSDDLLRLLDRAVLKAKAGGKNKIFDANALEL